MKMRQHHNIILRWDETLYKEREQAHNYRVAQKQKHLEKHPGQKELINYASMRNELIYYGNNITGNKSIFVIKQKYRNYEGLHGYGNVSYLADFDLKSESNDAEASENQDFNALGNEEISKGLSFCDKEAGYSLELGIPHAIQPPSLSTTPTKHIDSWFPTWQDGVCRIIGQISSSSKLIITGAILSFSETDQTFTTLQCNYKFSENIDKKSLAKYMKMDPGLSFITDADNMYSTLQQDNWLENIVKLSLQSEYAFFKFSGASINKFLLKDRQKSVSGVLFEKKAPKIPSNLCKSVKCPDYESICKELENLLEIVQNNGDWRKHFQILLKKCGQNVDHDLFREKDPNETLTFEGFLEDGNMCNSTLNKIEAQLVLWSIVKDINDGFCIKGLEYVDDKKKFYEIKPSPITRDTDYGAKVIAEKCSYKLLGPLYALSIRLAYPNFLNSDYLWPFLSYFRMGLPKNWKNYISIIDILSKCSLLRYVSRNTNAENLNEFNLSEKTMMNNSPSFIPSTSILSSSNNKDSSNNKENYRRSIKRNSTITSKSLRENNTNNEENDVFKENDKAICKRLSDMTNVFCSLDQTENIYKNKKSILKNRTSVRNVGATSSLDAHSIIQKTHNVAVVENELPLNLKISRHCVNNKVNTEFKVSNQMCSQRSRSNQLKFTEQKVQKSPETKVKKKFESNKKINNLKNVAIEDFQCPTQISRDLNSPLSVGRTSSNTVQIYQSPFQSICSRKRKSQQVLIETPSKKKRLNNVEETKVSQNKESFGNQNKKLKSVLNVEETKKRYNRKSDVNMKPECSSVSKVRFSLNSETPNQTERKKRTSMNKSRKVQAEPTDSDGIESDLYFQADNFLINIKTTRSGRKSIPPIDPRSDIERFQEDGKPYLISKGQKFEL